MPFLLAPIEGKILFFAWGKPHRFSKPMRFERGRKKKIGMRAGLHFKRSENFDAPKKRLKYFKNIIQFIPLKSRTFAV